MTPPEALIFDWDNTLIDSWLTIHAALNVTLVAMGHETWCLDETKSRVRQSLRDSFPQLFGERWQEARRIYLETFEATHLDRLQPLPGAESLLVSLKSERRYLALVSNKTGRLLRREAEALGWTHFFGRIVGAGDASVDKPDRAPVDLALGGSGIVAGPSVWFVGDTGIDMECALNAGCVGVLINAEAPVGSEFEKAQPAVHFKDCMALSDAIMRSMSCNGGSL